MRRYSYGGICLGLSLACASVAPGSDAVDWSDAVLVQETWTAGRGSAELTLDVDALIAQGITLLNEEERVRAASGVRVLDVAPSTSMFQVVTVNDDLERYLGGELVLGGADVGLRTRSRRADITELHLAHDVSGDAETEMALFADAELSERVFDLAGAELSWNADSEELSLQANVLLSSALADRLRAPRAAGAVVGRITLRVGTELTQSVSLNNEAEPVAGVLPAAQGPSAAGGDFPTEGPDVIVGTLVSVGQYGRTGEIGAGIVGLAIGTTSCNKGNLKFNWFQLPNIDHPTIPMNLYRLKTVDGSDRFEQIGQSWMKHGFTALQHNACGFGCTSSGTGTALGVGCSDPYSTGLNASQCGLGPRSVLNPYTGEAPSGPNMGSGGGCGSSYPSRNHTGHAHSGISHRLQVRDIDLMPGLNNGARYFGEAQYLTPHEFNAANGNQNNNVSHREVSVSGPSFAGVFTFSNIGSTVREEPAVNAWPGAQQSMIEPAPMEDGRAYLAYKVTDLGNDRWHYEYVLYNMHLDRSIGAISIPVPDGVELTNVEMHFPFNHAEEANSDTYSNIPWAFERTADAAVWSTSSFNEDPMANAVRFGTSYNFRFDADVAPGEADATVTMFKTGEGVSVTTQSPFAVAPVILDGTSFNSFETHSFTGYVDPRDDSDNGADPNGGIDTLTIRFNTGVEDLQGGGLTPAAFEVRQTNGGQPPNIAAVESQDNRRITITLDRPITPGEWTTVIARVKSLADRPIADQGDLGPGVVEADRIDIGFLPCDVDQNGRVEPLDLLRFRQIVAGTFEHPKGLPRDYVDTDRDGSITPVDLLRFRQLWFGTGTALQSWQGAELPPQP